MPEPIPNSPNLFLTNEKRKEVKPSSVALKAIARAPLNLALYDKNDNPHDVLAHVLQVARSYYTAYQNQWSALTEKWDKSDSMYWMEQKESRMPELTRSKVSASSFHRVVRRIADGAYLATFSEDMPVKFFPDIGIFDQPEDKKKKAVIAEGLNRLALYSMKKNDMKVKARKSFLNVYKYGNHIAYVPYEYVIEKKRSYKEVDHNERVETSDGQVMFKHTRTETLSNVPHPPELYEVEQDEVVRDWVGFEPLDLDDCLLDNTIDDLDRQQCFFHRSKISRSDIWRQAKVGNWKNIERITQLQQFQQYDWQSQAKNNRITNAGKTTTDNFNTESYDSWKVWIMLPKIKAKFNKKGEVTDMTWDQNAEECRYLLEIVGTIEGNSVVTRLSESPYWGNGIPYIDCHSHEDDSGWYHRGLMELLEDNMLQEQVAKGQLMDNRALMMFRPVIRQVGKVKNKDLRITHNTTFDVYTPNALTFMDIPDFTANLNNTIQYLKQDSESLAQVPSFMIGEALGGRTSATEFAAIRDQSSAPQLNDIKNMNLKFFGGWMKKFKEYIPQFLDREVAIEVAGEQGQKMLVYLKAEDFQADVAVMEYAVQEFQNKATMQQIMINLAQMIATNPMFNSAVQPVAFLERFFQQFNSVFPNPEEILRKDEDIMAMIQAYLAQAPVQQPQVQQQMAQGGPTAPNLAILTDGQQEAAPTMAAMGAMRGA